jgi:uncharacterized membrane protein
MRKPSASDANAIVDSTSQWWSDGFLDWEQVAATGHVLAASTALVVGAAVLMGAKGTQVHRVIGSVYVLTLVVVDGAALSLHREDTFGVFHVLAVASLLTIAVGLSPLLMGNRSQTAVVTHAYCMVWSYAGLVAAGCGQLAAAVGPDAGPFVPVTIAVVLFVSGILIFGRVPSTLDRLLPATPTAALVARPDDPVEVSE